MRRKQLTFLTFRFPSVRRVNIFAEPFATQRCTRLGKPGGSLKTEGDKTVYRYYPFHRFEISFTAVVAEPLVFFRDTASTFSLAGATDVPTEHGES
jgi:hypothetical protein